MKMREMAVVISLIFLYLMAMNEMTVYGIELAGITLNTRFHYTQRLDQYSDFLKTPIPDLDPVELESDDIVFLKDYYHVDECTPDIEYKMLFMLISEALLPFNRVIMHSVAFVMNGRSILLTGPSGIGKSTQYRHLKKMFPEEIHIISGDGPVLEVPASELSQSEILVHPSPWNGKESWGDDRTAPLSGIVILEQSDKNCFQRLSPENAVIPVFYQLNTFSKTENSIRKFFELEEKILAKIPVWRFQNTGDEDSSFLLYSLIKENIL